MAGDTSGVVTALQTINASITGVKRAPTDYPSALRSADLPMALVYPMQCEHGVSAVQRGREARTWVVSLYVQPISQGTGVDEGFDNTVVFIDRFGDEYRRTANQKAGTAWNELQFVNDTGVRADLRLHGVGETRYWGIQFELLVIQLHDVAD
jgi:hypothetical protein